MELRHLSPVALLETHRMSFCPYYEVAARVLSKALHEAAASSGSLAGISHKRINIDSFLGEECTSRIGFSLSAVPIQRISKPDRLKPVLLGLRNAWFAGFQATKTKDRHGCGEKCGLIRKRTFTSKLSNVLRTQ